jgi:hypothetical protein
MNCRVSESRVGSPAARRVGVDGVASVRPAYLQMTAETELGKPPFPRRGTATIMERVIQSKGPIVN